MDQLLGLKCLSALKSRAKIVRKCRLPFFPRLAPDWHHGGAHGKFRTEPEASPPHRWTAPLARQAGRRSARSSTEARFKPAAFANGAIQLYSALHARGQDRPSRHRHLRLGSGHQRSLAPTARGYSVAAAAERCRELALVHQETKHVGGLRERQRQEKRAVRGQEGPRGSRILRAQTLAKLLDAYCDHLEAAGRRSHADARSIFRKHIKERWPGVAAMPAAAVTKEAVTDMLRALLEPHGKDSVPKGRTSNMLRAYLRAMYQCALDVDSLASIPSTFRAFQISSNPAALTRRIAQHDRA